MVFIFFCLNTCFPLCLQSAKSSAEMEEFLMMKQQLQEKEELVSTLQTQLSQTQAEQAAQVRRGRLRLARAKTVRAEGQGGGGLCILTLDLCCCTAESERCKAILLQLKTKI